MSCFVEHENHYFYIADFISFRIAAVIKHSVSARKRKQIVERADLLNIKVVNRTARLRAQVGFLFLFISQPITLNFFFCFSFLQEKK